MRMSQTVKNQRVVLAGNLRHNASDSENVLWAALRDISTNGTRCRRQHPLGNYIVDFVCLKKKLIIEVDGGQHNERPDIANDEKRTEWLTARGYRVVRFWNNDVLENIEGVIYKVLEELN
jgi:very-short-patch-repair endonuclease